MYKSMRRWRWNWKNVTREEAELMYQEVPEDKPWEETVYIVWIQGLII